MIMEKHVRRVLKRRMPKYKYYTAIQGNRLLGEPFPALDKYEALRKANSSYAAFVSDIPIKVVRVDEKGYMIGKTYP